MPGVTAAGLVQIETWRIRNKNQEDGCNNDHKEELGKVEKNFKDKISAPSINFKEKILKTQHFFSKLKSCFPN